MATHRRAQPDADPPGKPQRSPFVSRCGPGKYAYCRCGRSEHYPMCDGTHRDSDITPLKIILEEERTVAWCACGTSRELPYCDGSHAPK